MKKAMRIVGTLGLVALMAVAFCAIVAPTTAMAKGKPKPPPCDCPETIDLGNGIICTLVDCGFDCVYSCPLPFP